MIPRSAVVMLLGACAGPERTPDHPSPGGDGTVPADVAFHEPEGVGALLDPPSQTCDAGTDAWVQRVFPLVIGRRPHGSAEVQMWTSVADQYGRDVAIRAMTNDQAYIGNWRSVLADLLLVSRSGPDYDDACHQYPLLGTHDGSLAQHIRSYGADEATYGTRFNMADVLIDSLVADDLAAAWTANIYGRTNYIPVCSNTTDLYQIELERRLGLGDEFLDNYMNRSITCMTCHNSEFSVTDSPAPSQDRTWGVPGALFEKTLFDASTGPVDPDGFYSLFRYAGVVEDTYFYNPSGQYPVRPWGWDESCGTFDPTPPGQDYLVHESGYFLDSFGPEGTLFDVAGSLGRGADALSTGPLAVGEGGLLDPDQAFAYLTAQHLVDRVWEIATGSPLTLPYGYSRNQDQYEILESLTNRFLTSGWSLRELLVAITTDPLYNTGLPATCGAPAYGLDPVLYAYSVEDPNPALEGNGAGDLVHRQYARVLVNTANHSLGWPMPDEWFSLFGATPDRDLASAIGVFLNRSEAGFSGTDLQGALAWEARFGTCSDPSYPNDFIQEVLDQSTLTGATLETAVLAIKDRLLVDGTFASDEERALVEDLLEVSLDTPVASAPLGTRRNLGLFCGALTLSPRFFLAVEPHPIGPVPPLSLGAEEDCTRLALGMAGEGVALSCDGWMPVP
jgi:hypothetical protein